MSSNNKIELILEGLDCANCSNKIELEANKISDISATINFMTKTLTIENKNNQNLDHVVTQVKSIVNKYEPHIIVKEKLIKNSFESVNSNDNSKVDNKALDGHKKQVIKLCIGGALFAFSLILNLQYWLELSLFLVSFIIVGGEIVLRALKNILKGQVFDENFLMSIATIGAFIIGEYPEGVAVMLFYQVGELFQNIAVNRSRRSISDLMDIRPDFANIKTEDGLKRVSPEEVKIGDIIIVKPGEKVPLDGKVIDGSSMVDTSALTGESVPRDVEAGNDILSGFINKNGVLTIEVTKEYGESTVSKILDLVQNASSKKAPTENFITKFARYYTPVVVFTALAIAIIPPFLFHGATFSDWVYRALIFLVISCPCALVISIPLGFFGGIGGASKSGVLVKGSNYLEALNSVETVIFDKTGTLTKGVFHVTEINPQEKYSKEELLEYAAYAESYSNHPIATSIIKSYQKEVNMKKIDS